MREALAIMRETPQFAVGRKFVGLWLAEGYYGYPPDKATAELTLTR